MPLTKIKSYVSDALKRSRDTVKRLEQSIDRKESENEKLRLKVEHLKRENEKLKDELKAARKPPSWAKSNKNKAKDGTKKASKKKGPKKGHSPNIRKKPTETPHQEIEIIPLTCLGCDNVELPDPGKWHTHTQIDIPEVTKPVITTFHVGWSWCATCGKYVSVNEKLGRSLYGPRLHAYICYLKYDLGMTYGKIQRLVDDQYNLFISTGQLSEMIKRTSKELRSAYDDIKTSLLNQNHLHADETSWRVDGNNAWLWSFANDDLSFYLIDESRGKKVVKNVLGDSFNGTLITDFYSAYNAINCDKQKCWVHLLRELKELKEKHPRNREIKAFAKKIKRFFHRGQELQEKHRTGDDIERPLKRLRDDTMRYADLNHRHSDLKRLAKRLHKFRGELYTFVKTGVDPTNNFAEREIRPAVLMRKTSYGNRSDEGAETQSILMTIARTARKRQTKFVEMAAEHLQALQ